MRWPAVLLGMLSCACPAKPADPVSGVRDAAPAPTESAPPTPTASSAPPDEPVPDPITHPCVVTSAQFDVAIQGADRSCRSNADCACIPKRVGSRYACGGVTSAKLIPKLRELEKEFAKMGCRDSKKCAQTVCKPRCVDGQCE